LTFELPPAAIAAALALQSPPPALPEPVRAMVGSALAAGDPGTVDAVAKVAMADFPAGAAEIRQMTAAHYQEQATLRARAAAEALAQRRDAERAAAAAAEQARIEAQEWKGEIELGASRSTGNTRNLGLYGALKLAQDTDHWRHRFAARADVQKTNDVTTTERITGSWQPAYKFDDRLYAFGLAQYDRDRFLGISHRLTAGGGVGYGLIAETDVRLDLEGGPAVRYTNQTDEPARTSIAARGSAALRWKVTPTFSLTQDAAFFLERDGTNATATTAIDTKLFGPLKARFSYNLQYEQDAPNGQDKLDTLSRATLIYGF
jgi:putative salt-induced outer membrane protein